MRLRFLVATAGLVCASLAAHADTFTLTGSAYGYSGTLTLTGNQVGTTGSYLITGVSGSGTSGPITVAGYLNNNNLLFPTRSTLFDAQGLSFYEQNPAGVYQVNLHLAGSGYTATYNEVNTTSTDTGSTPVTLALTSSTAATPEPSSLALLGTGALGVFGMARRRFLRA